ncbi:hypothetical protein KCG43_09705 [Photobacterium sp. WH24]|uniref:hypothetical protein n=1 Tax=Photobacterium sp. WH24 TaxID=2827237 RepID=UPI001C464825|nr:hypothetical protein [Photobacterium sp. WH24]MBV7262272.1 hypothetical protein [Photobacterium sp. WH24]
MLKKMVAVLSLVFSTTALAEFSCEVEVNRVLVYANGSVNVLHSGRNEYTYICNLNTARQGVGITTCAMWTSMLQNIQKSYAKAIFYYPGSGDCSTLATYGSAPVPVYIGSIK